MKTSDGQPLNLKKRILSNTFFSFSNRIVNVLIKAILAPLVITNIGLDGFGVWNLLVSVTNYPRFGVGGAQAAFQKYVSDATGTGDYARASRLLSTGSVIIFIITSVVGLPFLIFSQPIVEFLNIPGDYIDHFSIALRILIVVVIISNTTTAYSAILSGAHRLDLVAKIGIFTRVAEAVLIVILLFNGYRLFALALPFCVSQLIRVLFCAFFARQVLPSVSLHPKNFSTDVMRDLLKYAGSFHLLGMLEMLYLALVPALVMRYFGASISGLFAAATRLISIASLAAESLMLPLLSGSAFIVTKNAEAKNRFLFAYSLKFIVYTGVPIFVYLSFFADPILFAWTKTKHEMFTPSMFFLSATGMCTIMSRHHMIIYRATGQRVHDLIWMMIRFAGLFSVGIFLANRTGYLGLLFGMIIGEALGLIFMIIVMNRFLEMRYIGIGKALFSLLALTIFLMYSFWHMSEVLNIFQEDRISVAVSLMVIFALYLLIVAVLVWFGMSRQERELIQTAIPIERMKKILRMN